MWLDILINMFSMRNSRRHSEPKNAAAATATVNNFLYILCATRVKQYSDGRYAIQNVKVRSAIIFLSLLGWDIYSTYVLIDIFGLSFGTYYAMFTWIQIIYSAVATNCRSKNQLDSYYRNLAAIDNYINKNDYKKDKSETNLIFFIMLILRVLSFILDGWAWSTRQGVFLAGQIHIKRAIYVYLSIYYMGYVHKINILKIRVRAMLHRLSNIHPYEDTDEESSSPSRRRRRRCEEKVNQDMKDCYIKMFEHCQLLNETDGIPVLLTYSDIIIHSIILISATVTVSRSNWSETNLILASTAVGFGLHVLLLVTALVILRRIVLDLEKTQLVVHNTFILNTKVPAAERQSWLEFSELLRRNPLVFTAYDFFVLDFSLLARVFGVIVTYTIVKTQFK